MLYEVITELLVCAEITGVQNKVEGEDTVASTVTYNAREETKSAGTGFGIVRHCSDFA